MLGAFFYGYMLTNFIGGRLAEHFGGRLVYGLGILCTGILTLLSPVCARLSTGLFVAVRLMEGLTEVHLRGKIRTTSKRHIGIHSLTRNNYIAIIPHHHPQTHKRRWWGLGALFYPSTITIIIFKAYRADII